MLASPEASRRARALWKLQWSFLAVVVLVYLFERYTASGVASDAGAHSAGLGLAFCALAVKAHGGSIRVESGEPRGSVFVVELPTRTDA
ncbi:MAG: ATP-binding protein [Gemmatimonadaceae bacterium]